jgi:hypothetical protein
MCYAGIEFCVEGGWSLRLMEWGEDNSLISFDRYRGQAIVKKRNPLQGQQSQESNKFENGSNMHGAQ